MPITVPGGMAINGGCPFWQVCTEGIITFTASPLQEGMLKPSSGELALMLLSNTDRALLKDLAPLFDWMSGDETIQTASGPLRAIDWLRKERDRVRNDPKRTAYIVVNGEGQFTLFTDVVAG